ncbi:procathepsin L-like [Harmonia axyridis]|uniref:procathepsin L-like n=1 Tax=Harmonia axyridis TaxID=115357 RepID=UPI001E276AF0|nr:procathepsin L-like [Harmonia axyridis]
MKFALCFLAVIIGCQAISDEEALSKWQNYQEEFGKSYRSLVEHRHRFALFKQKLQEIEEHNKLYAEGKVTWYKGVTPFSDWTSEEFNNYINKYKYEEFVGEEQIFKSENLSAPLSMDWRQRGAVSEVKNQGTCGSCWTFSSTGALEGAARMKTGAVLSLSEQNLLDCSRESYNNFGCSGGNVIGAFQYVQENGITTEDNYPYTGVQGPCKASSPVMKATGFVRVPQNENDLLNAVGSIGPVSIAIVSTQNLQDYSGGILNDSTCAGQNINHGVLAVGYGSANGVDYWIIKNSWGPKWGEQGYWRMIRGVNSCGITLQARYPLV